MPWIIIIAVIAIAAAVIFIKKKNSGTRSAPPFTPPAPDAPQTPERPQPEEEEENIQIIAPRPAPAVDPEFVIEDNMISVGTDERIV